MAHFSNSPGVMSKNNYELSSDTKFSESKKNKKTKTKQNTTKPEAIGPDSFSILS